MKIKNRAIFFSLLFISASNIHAQSTDMEDWEIYSKANIAFTNFKILGVTSKQYAKCVESINYYEPSKTHKRVVINDMQFVDDGNNYDLVANDGILTSVKLDNYEEGDVFVPIGTYKNSANNPLVCDISFRHLENSGNYQTEGFKIRCRFRWEKCSDWQAELQTLCRKLSWPFGGSFLITECEIEFS